MTDRMLDNRCRKLQEIKLQIKALEDQQAEIEKEIKAEFTEDQEEIRTGKFLIRWTKVITNRLDSTALKKDLPDVYKKYTKAINSRRFSVA